MFQFTAVLGHVLNAGLLRKETVDACHATVHTATTILANKNPLADGEEQAPLSTSAFSAVV